MKLLDTKILPHTGFGISIMDIHGDDEVEAWVGTQSSNHLMVIKLADKELSDVSPSMVREFISSLQQAVSANQKKIRK